MRHLLDIIDLSVEEINELIILAEDIAKNKEKYSAVCNGKKIATLFYEPSTRTRMSFEAAMLELGGNVICCTDINTSSIMKGEGIRDTVRVVGNYADIIALRHPYEGTAYVASECSPIPVINAGDGGHCHPTQTLADLLTIHSELKRLDNLTIGICGDLKYGRTVHSLINAMIRYENVKFVMISPKELRLPNYMLDALKKANAEFKIVTNLEENLSKLDCLYMTRIQKERFEDEREYEKVKDTYVLTLDKLKRAKDDMIILHPLPRVNEISQDVDSDKRAVYFKQTLNGKFMRMALIIKLLEKVNEIDKNKNNEIIYHDIVCDNRKCISKIEPELKEAFTKEPNTKNVYKCLYCETIKVVD